MLTRDAGWAALAALVYGWCCCHLAWGALPPGPGAAAAAATPAGPADPGRFGPPG